MAVAASTLIAQTRRLLGDWPSQDALTASVSSSATSLTVADSSIYAPNWIIQVDDEAMRVRTAPSVGTSITVFRGDQGTTAASHASSASVLVKPRFLNAEILDELNAGIRACFPLIYKPVAEDWSPTVSSTYEYTVPDVPGGPEVPIPYLYRIELKRDGEEAFFEVRDWRIVRSSYGDPFIKFRRAPVAGATMRIHGFAPFPTLTASTDSLDTWWPGHAEDLPPLYAASMLLASGEARRVRVDTGVIDNREQANRTGSSMQASNGLLARFERRLAQAAMPPMPKHVIPSF